MTKPIKTSLVASSSQINQLDSSDKIRLQRHLNGRCFKNLSKFEEQRLLVSSFLVIFNLSLSYVMFPLAKDIYERSESIKDCPSLAICIVPTYWIAYSVPIFTKLFCKALSVEKKAESKFE